MNLKLLSLFFFTIFISVASQNKIVIGSVKNENENNLQNVYVYNPRTEELVKTDLYGNFMISAVKSDDLRIVKTGYERINLKISENDFQKHIIVTLTKLPFDIPEVEIDFNPTGDLKKDSQIFGDSKPTKKMKAEVSDYISSYSTPEVLAPKHGEFVQPVGPGFSVGKIDPHWDDVDFMNFLIKNLGEEFFTQDLKLYKPEIQPFIYYIFKNFERNKILFYGICTEEDLMRFLIEAEIKINWYQQNLPNNPPKKKKYRK